jgi:hypothetical protein
LSKLEVLKKFVKENAIFLTSVNASSETVKHLMRTFLDKHNFRSEDRFKLNDVVEEVLNLVLKHSYETFDNFVDDVRMIPFLKEKVPETKLKILFDSNTLPSQTIIKPEDLTKLEKNEFLKNLEEKYKQKVTKELQDQINEKLSELNRRIEAFEKEKKGYEKFKSELDSIPPSISLDELVEKYPSSTNNEVQMSSAEWWEEAGLTGDPFPSNLGLTGISPEKYGEIVVETPFIRDYIDKASKGSKTLMGKTTLLLGEFGSGKTTLFQYLSYKVSIGKILPINVILNPGPRIVDLTSSMLQQIYKGAAETYKVRIGIDPRREDSGRDIIIDITDTLTSLSRENVTEGFLILLDGLHKGNSYGNQVFEFLQQIQNVHEYFSQQSIQIGFIIAGSMRWKNEILNIPSLSGSFYAINVIPPITAEYAVMAFKKRIKSFSIDPSDEPVIKDDTSLLGIFELLQRRLAREVTFRDFLDYVRQRLDARNYKELGVEVALNLEIVTDVRSILNKSIIGRNYRALWAELYKKPFLKAHCKDIMRLAFKHGIAEDTLLFKDNKTSFFLLRRYGFLYQVRVDGEESFRWYPASEVVFAISQVCKSLYISPSRALSAAFEEESAVIKDESLTIYAGVIRTLSEVTSAWSDTFPDITQRLQEAKDILTQVGGIVSHSNVELLTPDLISKPVQILLESIVRFIYGTEIEADQIWTYFCNSWVSPENFDSIKQYAYWETAIPRQQTPLYGLLQQHSQILADLLRILIEVVRGESVSRLLGRKLSFSDLQRIHLMRKLFLEQSYAEVADKMTTLMEERMRETVFPALRAIWGDKATKLLPKDLIDEINRAGDRGHPDLIRSTHPNFLYDISRSEYSKVLFNGDIYKAILGSQIKTPQEKEKVKSSFELAFSLNDRVAHRDEASYFADNAVNIGATLAFVPDFLERLNETAKDYLNEIEIDISLTNVESKKYVKSVFVPKVTLSNASVPILILASEAEKLSVKVLRILDEKEIYVNSLSDVCLLEPRPPEISLSIMRNFFSKDMLFLSKSQFFPLIISLTKKGKDFLESEKGPGS